MRYALYRFYTALSLFLLLTLTACSTTLFGFSPSGSTHARQVASSPTPLSRTVEFDLGVPEQALKSPALNPLPDNTPIHVVVTFKLNTGLLSQLGSQPRMQAGQSINVAGLANQLGISDQEYQQMQNFFGAPGITLHLNKLHTNMTIDAQAGILGQHLHVQFINRVFQGILFYAPSPAIVLPRELANHIEAMSGLDSYSKYQNPSATTRLLPLNANINRANGCVDDEDVLTPQQIGQAYGLNQFYRRGWTGQGTTIVLPEFSTFSRSDVDRYLACLHYRGKLSVVNVDNAPPKMQDLEPVLDIEMAAGLAPDANIVVYQTNAGKNFENFWPRLQDVFNKISDDYSNHTQPVTISVSWGNTEGYLTHAMLKSIDSTLEVLAVVEHVNIFAASGDCGAYDSADYPNTLDVGFPSSDPSVIAVGGTFLYTDNLGNRTSEVAWSEDPKKHTNCDNQWGSGGGLSLDFPRPTWQQGYTGIQNKYSNGQRQVPDVSAAAYYLACYIQGQWFYCAGTSAAAPIWATGYTLANQGLVSSAGYYVAGPGPLYILARQYANDNPFYDVQKGNNLYYPATPGWDFATGLGTPNMGGIYQGLLQFVHSA